MSGSHARRRWSLAVLLVCAMAGLLFAAAHATSAGADLRPAGGDVASLIAERSHRVEERQQKAQGLQHEIDALTEKTEQTSGIDEVAQRLKTLRDVTGLATARGPGMRVTLTDAPRSVDAPGIDPNYLVVHQQDIQAFINALWAGGAEAVSLQGQRLVSTTGIVCVGSTVVIDGVPYAPPYVIEAVGDATGMNYSLTSSPEVINYRRYVEKFQLGLDVESSDDIVLEPYRGTTSLRHAKAVD